MKERARKAKPDSRTLLAWYDRHRRHLPWRAAPGVRPDPYAVWLSEIMLQQTTVTAVKPYFESFLRRWPTITQLAAAPLDEVMAAWAGLGYYARARNLHKCAGVVTREHGGVFPETVERLLELPGIGPYTAAAIAAIAFDRPATVVDGNVERVMARVFAVSEPLPESKAKLRALAATLTPSRRPGDYAQAVMDLGATICTPTSPACVSCPWNEVCEARGRGIAHTLPRKDRKAEVPQRYGVAFWMVRKDGAVLMRRRPPKGLLGGMIEVPSTPWRARQWSAREAAKVAPLTAKWRALDGTVTHVFTHFRLELQTFTADLTAVQAKKLKGAIWTPLEQLDTAGLPSVMRKVAMHALRSIP